MHEIRLDSLLTGRPSLRPGEVVTVVTSVARDLAAMHAAGGVHGALSAETVLLGPAGRPRLVRPLVPPAGASPDDDVRALAALGNELLGPYPPQRLVWTLHEATGGDLTATALATKVLAACRPEPVRYGTTPPPADAGRAVPQPPPPRPWGRVAAIGLDGGATEARGRHARPDPSGAAWLGGFRGGAGRRVIDAVRGGIRGRGRWLVVLLVPLLLVAGVAAWAEVSPPGTAGPHAATRSESAAATHATGPTESPAATSSAAATTATGSSAATRSGATTRSAAATGSAGATTGPTPATGGAAWRARLERLDRQRAAAYARGDAESLRAVYVPGAKALSDDLATLRAYERAGLRVRGLRLRVDSVREVTTTRGGVTLAVTDRLEAYQLVDSAGKVVDTERGRPAKSWHVTLRPLHDSWRIAAIQAHT